MSRTARNLGKVTVKVGNVTPNGFPAPWKKKKKGREEKWSVQKAIIQLLRLNFSIYHLNLEISDF